MDTIDVSLPSLAYIILWVVDHGKIDGVPCRSAETFTAPERINLLAVSCKRSVVYGMRHGCHGQPLVRIDVELTVAGS